MDDFYREMVGRTRRASLEVAHSFNNGQRPLEAEAQRGSNRLIGWAPTVATGEPPHRAYRSVLPTYTRPSLALLKVKNTRHKWCAVTLVILDFVEKNALGRDASGTECGRLFFWSAKNYLTPTKGIVPSCGWGFYGLVGRRAHLGF